MILRENKFFNVEGNDDENYRIYHTRMELLEKGWSQVAAYKGVQNINEVTAIPEIMALFLNTPGVVWVRVMNYQIEVRKSPLFTWEELDQTLLSVLLGTMTALSEPEDMGDILKEISSEQRKPTDSDLPLRIDDGADPRRDQRLLSGDNSTPTGLDDADCTAA